MPCSTVGDGGGGVTQSPFILLLSLPPHGPHPQHPSLHTFSSPLSPSLSSQACPSQPREQWGSCVCRLFPTITFNYGSLQCGLVKGLAIRSLPLFSCLSLLTGFWSLARLHVKKTQIAPCSLYTPHSSLYVSQPRPEYLRTLTSFTLFFSILFGFSTLLPPPPGVFSSSSSSPHLPLLYRLPF